jgi:hypothetical protein
MFAIESIAPEVIDNTNRDDIKRLGKKLSSIIVNNDHCEAINVYINEEEMSLTEESDYFIRILPSCGSISAIEINSMILWTLNKRKAIIFQWLSNDHIKISIMKNGILLNGKYFIDVKFY